MLSQILRDLNSVVIISIFIGLIFIKVPDSYFISRNIRLAEFLIKTKDFENAKSIILECFKKNPNKTKLYDLYGRLLIEEKDLILAEKILLEGLNKDNKYPHLHYNLAILYLLSEEIEKAEDHNKKALNKLRKNPKVFQQKIIILFKKGRYKDIINFYESNLKKFEKNNIIQEEIITYTLFSVAQLNDPERYNKLLEKLNFKDLKNKLNSYHILVSSSLMEDEKTIKMMLNYMNSNNIHKYLTKEQRNILKTIEEKQNSNSFLKTIQI